MLIAASLGLRTRLVTELTVYMQRSRVHLYMRSVAAIQLNDDLVRGVAMTRVRATLAHHPGYVYNLIYYYATAPLKMDLGVSKNIMIDSIDELH